MAPTKMQDLERSQINITKNVTKYVGYCSIIDRQFLSIESETMRDVLVMFVLRFFAIFKLLQFMEGHVVIEVPITFPGKRQTMGSNFLLIGWTSSG